MRALLLVSLLSVTALPTMAERSNPVKELQLIFTEFQGFRESRKFKEQCYSSNSPFADWAQKVNGLNAQSGLEIMREVGVIPSDLWQLGMEYCRGTEKSSFAQDLDRTFFYALTDFKVGKGQKKVARRDIACPSINSFKENRKAMDEGRYSDSEKIWKDGKCYPLYTGEVITGPVARDDVGPKGGSNTYVQVVRENGEKLWILAASFADE